MATKLLQPVVEALPRGRLDELLVMLDRVFESGGVENHRSQYPLALDPANVGRIRVVVEQGRIVSAAAALPVRARLAGRTTNLGLIGNVATDPESRGRGHASRCVRACEQILRDDGCLFSVLWSDNDRFYRRLGYTEAGTEWDLVETETLDARGIATQPVSDVRERAEIYTALTRKRTTGLQYSEEDLLNRLSIPGLDFRVIAGDSKVRAFAIADKGQDLHDFIHEWGGEIEAVEDLLVALAAERSPRQVVIMTPDEAILLRRRLARRGLTGTAGEIGFFKLLDPWGVVRVLREPLFCRDASGLSVGVHPDGLVLRNRGRSVLVPNEDVARLLFGWRGPSRVQKRVSEELATLLDGLLPLPFFLWGLDSC